MSPKLIFFVIVILPLIQLCHLWILKVGKLRYKHCLNEVILSYQGDLGAIDDKYDVAISTACGALDNIVCDSIDTAQRCITFLKHNNIGAATFIGLDKVNIKIILF